ncbi:MAG: peroxisome- protein [Trichoglossum hirsutum]|nr:MAG: peroxisome- protein [Trichoglossum hirsutum]
MSPSTPDPDGPTNPAQDPNPPTIASFSPATISHASSVTRQRATILVHQKSPLLVATPPQITRVLAYSHPFLLPLNKFAGLISWTSGDPWESFLLLAAFWAAVLYGDFVLRLAGPVVVVTGIIVGMYARRYSPLSSTGWTGEKVKNSHARRESESSTRHHKSLDEIIETLKDFTSRCNVLLEPLLRFTDFLSTQRTATSATTRPALTTLFIRILLLTPLWVALTLPPLRIITTKRIVLTTGTIFLTWHSRPARVSREIVWRSAMIRRLCATITGLTFDVPESSIPALRKRSRSPQADNPANNPSAAASLLNVVRRPGSPGVRFTFILYENQRRWLGVGWTYSLLAYERSAWTDEHLNPAPSKDEFELPEVEGGGARWRWLEDSEWRIDGGRDEEDSRGRKPKKRDVESKTGDGGGWIYYDNKWRDGRRGQDSWGRYTRRRKWYRDAELVEDNTSTEATPSVTPDSVTIHEVETVVRKENNLSNRSEIVGDDDGSSSRRRRKRRRGSRASGTGSFNSSFELGNVTDGEEHRRLQDKEVGWEVGDDAKMGLS